jgi:hypothetical protein
VWLILAGAVRHFDLGKAPLNAVLNPYIVGWVDLAQFWFRAILGFRLGPIRTSFKLYHSTAQDGHVRAVFPALFHAVCIMLLMYLCRCLVNLLTSHVLGSPVQTAEGLGVNGVERLLGFPDSEVRQ